MKSKLKFGLSQINNTAPVWLINTASVVMLLATTKHYLVENMPISNEASKQLIGLWFDYLLDVVQVVLAIAVIFIGKTEFRDDNTRGKYS